MVEMILPSVALSTTGPPHVTSTYVLRCGQHGDRSSRNHPISGREVKTEIPV
jgi:hypothetical protein